MKIGDSVMLKSGGPEMTVEGLDNFGLVNCIWFDDHYQVIRDIFNSATLEEYVEDFPTPQFSA